MKKIIALALALLMVLTMASAVAETRTYQLAGVLTEEGDIVDLETCLANGLEFPLLVFAMDDEAMECAFGTEDEMITGTMEITNMDEESGSVALHLTLTDGTEMDVVYIGQGMDAVTIVDAESGMTLVLMNQEQLLEMMAA